MDKSTLTREELAIRWHIKPSTLDKWRRSGQGPQFSKTDGDVFYKLKDVESYEKSRTFQGTADYSRDLRRKKRPHKEA